MRILTTLLMLGFLHLGYAQTCENNLMPANSDFENGTLTGWEVVSGQVEVTTDAYNGNFAMVAHTTGDKSEFAYTTPYFPNPSQTCVLTACGKIIGNPDNAGFGIIYGNLFLQPIRVDSIPITNTSYECFSITVDPPPGTFGFAISGSISGGNGSLFLDDFCFQCNDDCIVGNPCDDGDPNTINDFITPECECVGSACGVIPDAGDDVAIVLGQSTVLTASGGVSYMWNTGQPSPSISVSPTQTTTYTVTVSDGADCSEVDSVTVSVLEFFDVGNRVWNDTNGDGCLDASEEGINNVRIELWDSNNIRLTGNNTGTLNGEDGYYNFSILPGEYRFKVIPPSGTILSPKKVCGDNATDSDFDPTTGFTDFFTVNGDMPDLDVGLIFDIALPVELSHFQVKHNNGKNKLLWNVITEVDLDNYIIERKFGSESFFQEIASIKATNSDTYQATDYDLNKSGTYYYRLIMEDNNGHLNVSNIVSVEVTVDQEDYLHVFPNPATSEVSVLLNTAVEVSKHKISIYDTTGQRLFNREYSSGGKYIQKAIDISQFPNGIYSVLVKADETSFVTKLVKVE